MEEKEKEDLEQAEESETKANEDSVKFQTTITVEWIDGLMQRIQQSLISSTPLIVCEKDLDALDFLVLAASVAEPKAILVAAERMKEEAEKAQSTESGKG